MNDDDTYLGDGVYARFDGYHIILELTQQYPRDRIALEPSVFDKLVEYKEGLVRKYQKED